MDTDLALLLVVTATALAVVGWAGRKRFPLRIGVGNFFRRKTQVAIVVAGLLIGTAIVTSSFVIQRTFDYTIRSAVFRSLDLVDETISVRAQDDSRVPFNIRSEEHTSELQSRFDLVCRLLLEKKKTIQSHITRAI